jgi:hypothetical protein
LILILIVIFRKVLERSLEPTNADGIRSLSACDEHSLIVSGGLDGVISVWRWKA